MINDDQFQRDPAVPAARQRYSVPARSGSVSQIHSLPGLLDEEGAGGLDGPLAEGRGQGAEDAHLHRM